MRVTVRLFARLRDIAGTGELAREVAAGATIADVWAAGRAESGARALRAVDLGRASTPTTRG